MGKKISSYRMPAEWEAHKATWLAWPTNCQTWPGRLLGQVESIFIQMISCLLAGEKVNLLVPDKKTAASVIGRLENKTICTNNLVMHFVKTRGPWIRDYGPIFVVQNGLKYNLCHPREGGDLGLAVDSRIRGNDNINSLQSAIRKISFIKWQFNAWGGKYPDHVRDGRITDVLTGLKGYKKFSPGMVLEGGSIDVNGCGTLLTTEQCLLNPNRNPGFSRRAIERNLEKFLGVKKILWLKNGIEGDDTDGHVDDITRFVRPRTILTAFEDNSSDDNYACLRDNFDRLKSQTDADNKKFEIVKLPMPGYVKVAGRGLCPRRLPASYANFYIGNRAVLVPVYSHRNDRLALKIIRQYFPGRKVIGIECTALVYGRGSIHCVTQQEPL